jgi:hypothetical protein
MLDNILLFVCLQEQKYNLEAKSFESASGDFRQPPPGKQHAFGSIPAASTYNPQRTNMVKLPPTAYRNGQVSIFALSNHLWFFFS